MTFRSKKLRDSAQDCPACMSCGRENYDGQQLVLAHSNALRHGRGANFKTPDYMGAIVCGAPGACHDRIDGRAGKLSKDEKLDMWQRAWEKTVAWWFESGRVKV